MRDPAPDTGVGVGNPGDQNGGGRHGWDDWGAGPDTTWTHSPGETGAGPSRTGLVWGLGALVVVLLLALVGGGIYLATSDRQDPVVAAGETPSTSAEPAADPDSAGSTSCDREEIAAEAEIELRHVNVDRCLGDWALAHVYVPPGEPAGDTQYIVSRSGGSWSRYTSIPSATCRDDARGDGMPVELAELLPECREQASPTPTPTRQRPPAVQDGDLGLSVPITRPACDGRGIVVLYSAVTPGAYESEIASALAQHPGASYLRTDMSCPSLRQRDDAGNVIYAVYRPSGSSRESLCADVRAAGGSAYGRWLDMSSDPDAIVTC